MFFLSPPFFFKKNNDHYFAKWKLPQPDGRQAGPIVVFNPSDPSAMILSSFSNFMTVNHAFDAHSRSATQLTLIFSPTPSLTPFILLLFLLSPPPCTRTHRTVGFGVLGSITSIPADYVVEVAIQLGSGVNDVVAQYGALLQKYYGECPC